MGWQENEEQTASMMLSAVVPNLPLHGDEIYLIISQMFTEETSRVDLLSPGTRDKQLFCIQLV